MPRAEIDAGISIVDLLARTVADSKGAARRLIQQGGAYVNNVRIGELEHKITREHLVEQHWLLVRGGKKDVRLVRAV
jgi:tyrosyl-tRNA synthetase